MTTLKVESSPGKSAETALEVHVPALYADMSKTLVAIVELKPIERLQPAPGAEKTPSVKVRIVHCEVPDTEQVDSVREALRALYLQRTARGTIDSEGELQLADRTIDLLTGALYEHRALRLVAGLRYWQEYAATLASRMPAACTVTALLDEWKVARDGLLALIDDRAMPKDVERKAAKVLRDGVGLLTVEGDVDPDAAPASDAPGPVVDAAFEGKCPACDDPIEVGEPIRMVGGQAHHDECVEVDEPEGEEQP